jgi:uncharacterized protein (TIGR02453 family)
MALSDGLFGFLGELKDNNNREWFQAHKGRYEEQVKGPLLAFIGGFDDHLRRISAHFVADPRPVGGSLFRIYRDVRFSKDKSPYKTAVGIHFRHERAKDVHAPGYYLHLETAACFAACGLWMPATAQAQQVRAAIDGDQLGWRAARQAAQAGGLALDGNSLKRPPRGYTADHPLIEDLKRKDFTVTTVLDQQTITAEEFPARLEELWSHTTPFMRFVTEALSLPF